MELAMLRANDPELIEALREDIAVAKAAVERWTDNISTLRDFARDSLNLAPSEFDQHFDTVGIE
jgi:hypothetical protein